MTDRSTPLGARAKFAEQGKATNKKDLGQYAMTYKNVYVASICIHANHQQAIRALLEAEAYPGPSLVICYSPCISQALTPLPNFFTFTLPACFTCVKMPFTCMCFVVADD